MVEEGLEGVAADGTIRTGARRDRVVPAYEPVLADAVARCTPGASLYVYGSVACGTARVGSSDVDLLSVDLPEAAAVGVELSARYAGLCRGVEVSAASTADLEGAGDEAYGNRVFLRHYCVHLAGPDRAAGLPAFPADVRAARGFNGDIARSLGRWREARATTPPEALGVRIARKSLLAVAGLVSVHDRTWTTSRARAAQRWGEVDPHLAADLARLLAVVEGSTELGAADVDRVLAEDGPVATVVSRFADLIGLWDA